MCERKEKDPLIARMLLTFGGVFGLHRLYLEQIPEAFIYFSTFGVFGIGTILDIFSVHSLVDEYNDKIAGELEEQKKFRNGRLQQRLSKMVRSSVDQLVYCVAYAMWLGLLCWIAGSMTFGQTLHKSVVMISSVGAAVSAGIYVVGNRGGESRDLLYIWMSTLTATFVFGMLDTSVFRTILASALVGTVIGNRTAQTRPPQLKQYNYKHFVFWASLYMCLICIIALGASRNILQQRVAVVKSGESTVISSIDQLVQDRMSNIPKLQRFFDGATKIEYSKVGTPSDKKENTAWWDFDIALRAPGWADQVTVLIVDTIRAEARSSVGSLDVEPLQWALWRQYLLVYFDKSPFISDRSLNKLCLTYATETKGKFSPDKKDIAARAVERGCEVMKL